MHKDYSIVLPLTIGATSLNYNTIIEDRTSNISLNSTIINTQETFSYTRNLTQQAFETPLNFINEEVVETIPTITQQSISSIHPTITTPHNKNTPFPQHYNQRLLQIILIWIIKYIDQ